MKSLLRPPSRWLRFWKILLLLGSCNLSALHENQMEPQENTAAPIVVVVANAASQDSLAVARHYIKQRNLDPKHLIALPLPLQESISRKEFVDTFWNPLRNELMQRGLIDGRSGNQPDPDGYFSYVPVHASIDYLVLCKEVPLKIQSSPSRIDPTLLERLPAQLRTTKASVDSELAFIAAPTVVLPGPARNPLFEAGKRTATDSTLSISVTRLDGPSLQAVLNLIDRTLEAENTPWIPGRAYIDLHTHHPLGNTWLRSAASALEHFGYPVFVESTAQHWNFSHPHDLPAIYLGWYHSKASGPIMAEHVTLPPGTIAGHIHSTSAHTLRSTTEGWVGPLVERGASVTFGNVHEPYLELTLRPDLLITSLLAGTNLGDAALFATPFLSWQGIVIGDPLYRPFAPERFTPGSPHNTSHTMDPYSEVISLKRLAPFDPETAKVRAVKSFIESPTTIVAFHILDTYFAVLNPIVQDSLLDYVANNPRPEAHLVPQYLALAKQLQLNGDPREKIILSQIRAMLPFYPEVVASTYQSLLDAFSQPVQ